MVFYPQDRIRRTKSSGLRYNHHLFFIHGCLGLNDAGAKDGVRKKPAPDSVFAVIHQLGAEGLRAVYIGDSEVDLQTAQNAALPCISVSWGFRDRSVLEWAGAACICDTVDALYQAICNG